MATPQQAALTFLSLLVLCSPVDAAPRSGVARSIQAEPDKSGTAQQEQEVSPVLSRRVITKVDGVIVDDSASKQSNALLSEPEQAGPAKPQEARVPEGVAYGEVATAAEPLNETPLPPEALPEDEEAPEPVESENSGFFSNFFNPNREAESNRMRSGKGRAMYLAPEGESTPEYFVAPVPEAPTETPFIAPSRNLIVGEVVAVNAKEGFIVAWMQSRFIALERNVMTRNHELETTSVLQPTRYRNGRAYGLDIAVGQPSIGDEVVLSDAGPAIRRQDDLSVNVSLTVEPSTQN